MTKKRFENRLNKSNIKFNTLNPVWDNEKEDALNVFKMIDLLNELNDECEFLEIENESLGDGATRYAELYHKSLKENEQLKQFQKQVASVIESKMGDNVCNDYKMEVLKEIWNELELDEVWFE